MGPWILKKDYVELVTNQQIYQIPAGREINEILWFNRPELNEMLVDPFLGGFGGFGGIGMGKLVVLHKWVLLVHIT